MCLSRWGALTLCLLAGLPAYAGTPFDEFLASRPLAATTLGATDKMPIVQGDETRTLFPLTYFMRPDYSNGTTLAANAFLTGGGAGLAPHAVAITGLVLGAGANAPAAYAGTSCTNQFPRSLSAAGAATCASVANADLAGSIAASKLIGSDIATVGTIGTGTWQGSLVAGLYGGTGVANTGKTITLGGNLVTSGAFATTLTATATTGVTLPTTGTLATLGGAETLTSKTLTSPIFITPNVNSASAGAQAVITYSDAGTLKWLAGKQTDNSFLVYDNVNSASAFTVDTAGGVYLGESSQVTMSKTGGVILTGTTTNNDAAAGKVGEFVTAAAGATSITTNTQTNITSISLTAGDWDVEGAILFDAAASTVVAFVSAGINSVSATLPSAGTVGRVDIVPPTTAGSDLALPTGRKRISLSGTATIYLIGFSTFTVSTMTTVGQITARRVR